MHAHELVELAAIAAVQAGAVVTAGRLPFAALADYWSASKCRLDRWSRALKQLSTSGFAELIAPGPFGTRRQWFGEPHDPRGVQNPRQAPHAEIIPDAKLIVEEILLSEVLTRVWAAVLSGHDSHWGTSDAEPIARSVLIGHLEARHRALTLLAQGPGINSYEALELNRLRRRAERWTDLLLGQVLLVADASPLAFDADLAREFADELRGQPAWQPGGNAWSLALSSLRASFHPVPQYVSPYADLNSQIASAVIAAFPSEAFESAGTPLPQWARSLSAWPNGAAGGERGSIGQLFRHRPAHHQNSVRTNRIT